MKTNQVMKRQMGIFAVYQRTQDGYFEANELIRQWNETYDKKKTVKQYLSREDTTILVNTIIEREKPNLASSASDNQYVAYIERKGRNTSRGRTRDETYMNPILFIDFCMWINPEFKYDVLKFISDQMLQYRNDAGDAYRKLASSVELLVGKNGMPRFMPNISKALNYVIFGTHETMIRNNHGDETQQRELWKLEIKLADLIDDGFIKSYDELISYLRKKWCDKYQPKILDNIKK